MPVSQPLNVLFWNLQRKDLSRQISRIAAERNVHLLLLAEVPNTLGQVSTSVSSVPFRSVANVSRRIQTLVGFSPHFVKVLYESDHFSINAVRFPRALEYLIVGVHLPSKMYAGEQEQRIHAATVVDTVRRLERDRRHSRTVIAGDFNMDPFEVGMLRVDALNASGSMRLGEKNTHGRTYNGKYYGYFYNPMWNLLGDETRCPPGSYFRMPSGAATIHWRMFDQVLVRPEIRDQLPVDQIEILDYDGGQTLLSSRGRPNRLISDHLPLLFRLEMEVTLDAR